MKMKTLAVVSTVVLGLAVSGCTSKGSGYKSKAGAGAGSSDVSTQGIGERDQFDVSSLTDPASLSAHNTFYFGFDQYNIATEDFPVLGAHARYLKGHSSAKVRVEGHTDERGSREYNVGLGERRAKAVQQYLVSEGVSPDQIAVVSYGEEKPAANGHDESAYRLNRRAVIEFEAS